MPAPTNNANAAKPDTLKTSVDRLKVPLTTGERKLLMSAHRGRGSFSRFVALSALAAISAGIDPLPPKTNDYA